MGIWPQLGVISGKRRVKQQSNVVVAVAAAAAAASASFNALAVLAHYEKAKLVEVSKSFL